MEILAGLIIILLVVTLVGHGIWKVFALLGRALFGPVRTKPLTPPAIPVAKVDEVSIALGQISKLREAGLIDPEVSEQVITALLRQPPTPAQPEPAGPAPLAQLIPIAQIAPAAAEPTPLPLPTEHHAPVPHVKWSEATASRPAPTPSRPLSDVVASFMQQNNIRWGELIGGLLIIGGSAALVASFWAEIAQRPLFKFSLFTAVTAALFGIGLYSEHRWKLPTTSRGVLLIATLLVPLNCLALAAFAPRGAPGSMALLSQAFALALFACLLWLSARILTPQWPAVLTVGMVLLSAFMLVARIAAPADPQAAALLLLAGAPVSIYVIACALMLRTARRWKTIRDSAAEGIFVALGVFTFAALLGLLLLISQASSPLSASRLAQTLRTICLAISAFGLPGLAAGMLIWDRATGKRSNAIRIAGGAIAIIGGGILLLGLLLSWPQPSSILQAAAFDFAALLLIASLYELPAVLCAAIPCLAIAWLVAFHLIAGHIGWHDATGAAAAVFYQPSSGSALAPFAILLGILALLMLHRRRSYGEMLGGTAVVFAVIAMLLLNIHGFGVRGDPYFSTWIYLAFAILSFLAAWFIPLGPMIGPAWGLIFAAIAQFALSREIKLDPWAVSLLSWGTIAAPAFAIARLVRKSKSEPFEDLRYWIGLIASGIGAAMLSQSHGYMSVHLPMALFWFAGVWLVAGIGAGQVLVVTVAICSAVTALYIRSIHPAPMELEVAQWARLLLLNSTAISLTALVTSRFHRGFAGGQRAVELLSVRILLGVAGTLFAVVLIPTALAIVFDPGNSDQRIVGDGWTWLAAVAFAGAVVGRGKDQLDEITIGQLAMALLATSALISCTVGWAYPMSWAAYHTLLAGFTVVSWIVVGYGAWIGSRLLGVSAAPAEPSESTITYHHPAQSAAALAASRAAMRFAGRLLQPAVIGWAIAILAGVVLLSTRGAIDDPAAPWWAVGAIVGVACLLPMLASWACRGGLLIPASFLFNYAATIWYAHVGHRLFVGNTPLDYVLMNVVVMALSGLAWLVLDANILYVARAGRLHAAHRFAATASIVVIAAISAYGLDAKFVVAPVGPPDLRLLVFALLTTDALVFACLWERGAVMSLATIYSAGLLIIGSGLAFSTANAHVTAWQMSIALSGFSLLTAMLYASRRQVEAMARVVAIPVDARPWRIEWLIPANSSLMLIAIGIAYWVDFAFADRGHRIAAALAGLVGNFSIVLLAIGNRSFAVRRIALSMIPLAVVAVTWAVMSPQSASSLDLTVAVFVVATIHALIYFTVLGPIFPAESAWRIPTIRAAMSVGGAAAMAVLFAMGMELAAFAAHEPTPAGPVVITILLCAFLSASIALVSIAIRKKELAGSVRSAMIYAAECALALAFAHLRVTMPLLFTGVLAAYWPLILMLIAFAGVGVAETLRRRFDSALVRPIENTGVFLPLLPVLAFWLAPPRSVDYSTLLLTVAIFYGVVSVLRKSFLFAIVGVLAANGALWYLLHRTPGWGFLQHPQVWLIPGALAVMIAAQFNRGRMTAEQLRAVRYACLLVIYASSTADVFINGVATHPWLPLILAGISVAGALLGIMLRIRPFLYLGTTFLAVSIFTMIYFAWRDFHWTWIWWVALILLGGGIVILFGLFEKKRANMIGFVEGLRTWQ